MNNNIEYIMKLTDKYIETRQEGVLSELLSNVNELSKEKWNDIWEKLITWNNEKVKVMLGMECLKQIGDSKKYEQYLLWLFDIKCYNWGEKYFIWRQIKGNLFTEAKIRNRHLDELVFTLYESIFEEFAGCFGELQTIENRNRGFVLVTIQHFWV